MVRSWGLQFWNFGASKVLKLHRPRSPEWLWSGHGVCSFETLELWRPPKVPKLHRPRSPEWLWSGHGVCSFGTLELSNFHCELMAARYFSISRPAGQEPWRRPAKSYSVGRPAGGPITKASEASWSYSCDSKVSFDRVQILTPDFSGRRPPPNPPPPPPLSPLPTPPPLSSSLSSSHLPSLPPSSLFASSTPSCRRSLACG